MILLLLSACESVCLGDACEKVPDVPWDPGDVAPGGGGYGYGGDSGDSGDPDTTEYTVPREIVTIRDCEVTLKYLPSSSYSSLQAAGEFNDWTPVSLSGPDSDGYWSVNLGELEPGEYAYKMLFDGSWESEVPGNVYTKWVGDQENRNLRVGDCNLPLLQTVTASATSSGTLTATIQFASAADGSAINTSDLTVTVGDQTVTPTVDVEDGTISISVSGLASGKHSIRVWAADEAGRRAENEPLFVPLWVEDEDFVWEDGLMYFAFVDRFRNGDYGLDAPYDPVDGVAACANFNGGDYLGIIHALEEGYFEDLGINTIWLSPAYENPEGSFLGTDGTHYFTGYHGYWPIESNDIEDRYGDTEADADTRLRELISKAHERGIRVLFDLVLNHVHEQHSYVSEHPDWFGDGCVCGTSGCGWEEKPVECWFTDYLPDLSYKNHDITMQVLADTLRLVEEYDIDAVRIDAAKHMDHVIMRSLSMRLRDDYEAGGGAPFYLVGETFTSDHGLIMDYVADYELDGQFDFPLYYAIRNAFAYGGSFYDLESTVATGQSYYGDNIMSPFLGNHDVERFATAVDGQSGDCWSDYLLDPMADGGTSVDEWDLINKTSMAFAFTLTQPGLPLIYYGDEIGLHGGGDPDNRRVMNFDPYLSANQAELLSRVQAIGQARANSEALRRGERVQLWVEEDVLVYARDNGGGDVAIVAINKGGSSWSGSVPLSAVGVSDATFADQKETGRTFTAAGGSLSLSLGSQDYAILVRE